MSILFKILYDNCEFYETGEKSYIARNDADIARLYEPKSFSCVHTTWLKHLVDTQYVSSIKNHKFETLKYLSNFNYYGGVRTPINVSLGDQNLPVEGVLASIRLVSKDSKIDVNNLYRDDSKKRFDDDEIINNMFNHHVLTDFNGDIPLMFELVGSFKYIKESTYEDWKERLTKDDLFWMETPKTDYHTLIDTPELNTAIEQLGEVRNNAAKKLDEHLEGIVKQVSTLKASLEETKINSLRDFDTILNNVHIKESSRFKNGVEFEGCLRAWKELTPDIDLELELTFDGKSYAYGDDLEKLKPLLDFQDKVNKAGLTVEFFEDNLDEVIKDINKLPDNIDIKFTNVNKDRLIQQVSESAEDLRFIKNQLVEEYRTYINMSLSSIIDDKKIDAEVHPYRQFLVRMSVTEIED